MLRLANGFSWMYGYKIFSCESKVSGSVEAKELLRLLGPPEKQIKEGHNIEYIYTLSSLACQEVYKVHNRMNKSDISKLYEMSGLDIEFVIRKGVVARYHFTTS